MLRDEQAAGSLAKRLNSGTLQTDEIALHALCVEISAGVCFHHLCPTYTFIERNDFAKILIGSVIIPFKAMLGLPEGCQHNSRTSHNILINYIVLKCNNTCEYMWQI